MKGIVPQSGRKFASMQMRELEMAKVQEEMAEASINRDLKTNKGQAIDTTNFGIDKVPVFEYDGWGDPTVLSVNLEDQQTAVDVEVKIGTFGLQTPGAHSENLSHFKLQG